MSEVEQAMRRLKLGGMARNWRDMEYRDNDGTAESGTAGAGGQPD